MMLIYYLTLPDGSCRFPSTLKLTKAFGYNNYQEGKNRLLPLLRVCQSRSLQNIMFLKITSTVFAIQKCDPAPFYLFDEVGLSGFITVLLSDLESRLMRTWMHNIELLWPVRLLHCVHRLVLI
jgi:hypothetical protein